MIDSKSRLTRRRLLAGVATVGVASAGAGAGTMARFSNAEGSNRNTIEAGVLELTFGTPSTLDLTKDLSPGDSVSSSVELVNVSSLVGSLDVDASYTDSNGSATADDVARELELTSLSYGGTSLLGQVPDANTNGIVDLMDLATNNQTNGETTANDLIDLADPGAGTTFYVQLTLQNGTSNLAGNSIDIQFTFHLNQIDAQ